MSQRALRCFSLLVILSSAGCGASNLPTGWTDRTRTCVALSDGDAVSISHVGALMALNDAGIDVDCVAGSGSGGLIGALYARSPNQPIYESGREFTARYAAATSEDRNSNGLLGALVGFALGGPVGLAVGAASGAGATDAVDRRRLTTVLDDYLAGATFEELEVPLIVSYTEVTGESSEVVVPRTGSVAVAVGRGTGAPTGGTSMPGADIATYGGSYDRKSRTPIELACREFQGARIVAINVTGESALVTRDTTCPYLEIRIAPSRTAGGSDNTPETTFDELVAEGYQATCRAIQGRRCEQRADEIRARSTASDESE